MPQQNAVLLYFDLCAVFFKFLLHLFGFLFGDALFYRLGCAFDKILGFLETEAGDRTHDLDDIDLLFAGALRMTSNAVFSSTGAAAPPAAGAAAMATGAAALTSNLVSIILIRSDNSRTVMPPIASMISSFVKVATIHLRWKVISCLIFVVVITVGRTVLFSLLPRRVSAQIS